MTGQSHLHHSESRVPRRCRWFGHVWRSTVTGNVVDAFVSGGLGGPCYVRCDRCGAER